MNPKKSAAEEAIESGKPTVSQRLIAGLKGMLALNAIAVEAPMVQRRAAKETRSPIGQRKARNRVKNKAARKARKKNR